MESIQHVLNKGWLVYYTIYKDSKTDKPIKYKTYFY